MSGINVLLSLKNSFKTFILALDLFIIFNKPRDATKFQPYPTAHDRGILEHVFTHY